MKLFARLRSAEPLMLKAGGSEDRVAASARLRMLLEPMGSGRAVAMQVQSRSFEQLVERLARAGE